MNILPFSSSRTVLLLSDQALFIYKSSGGSVNLVASVPWGAHEFESDVAKILKGECRSWPVILLNDMVEQHYRKERVIKAGVSVMDRAGLVKRKLAFSFSNYPIRASLPLKEKKGKNKKGEDAAGSSSTFIFAAVPSSEQFEKVMGAVKTALVSVSAFCLLPVESSGMVSQLSARLEAKSKKKSQWTVFVGQNRGGGLRQIVTKDGQIAMTRITPVSSAEKAPEEWAQEVFREFSSTMSYVTRFGYQVEDGLHVIVIADGMAGAAVEPLFQESYDANVLSTQEAADILKLNIGNQSDEIYATPLHIAWVGRKSKFTLPMESQALEDVSYPRKVAGVSSVLLFLLACGLVYVLLTTALGVMQLKSDFSDKQERLEKLRADYNVEVARKERLGIDIRLVQSSLKIHKELQEQKVEILPLMGSIGRALGPDLRVDQIIVEEIDQASLDQVRRSIQRSGPPLVFQAIMQITYPPDVDVAEGNAEVEAFKNRLQRILPTHVVEVTKRIKDFEYVEEITVESGADEDGEEESDLIVEVMVRGPAS